MLCDAEGGVEEAVKCRNKTDRLRIKRSVLTILIMDSRF